MKSLEDKLEDLAFWVAIPTIKLTENNPHKFIRVLGFLCVFPLMPLMFPGLAILFLSTLVGIYKMI